MNRDHFEEVRLFHILLRPPPECLTLKPPKNLTFLLSWKQRM
jgi:hypothetical protein